MTIRELYQAIGSDFKDVLARIPNESLIERLVLKYPQEDSYELLVESMESGNYEEALTAVHTLKGLSQNLGFTPLGAACSMMNEALKAERYDNIRELYNEVITEQKKVVELIGRIGA